MRRATEDYVALAEVTRPHGIRGELKVKVYNPDSELLLKLRRVRMVPREGEPREVTLEKPRPIPGGLIIRLDGVEDRDAAEALRGARFEAPREALEPPDEGEFYVVDLVGCRAELAGEILGEVVDVIEYPTCHVLVVQRSEGRLEIPMLESYVGAIDPAAGRIEITSVEGLT